MSIVEKIIRLSKNSLEMLAYNSKVDKYRQDEKYKNMWLKPRIMDMYFLSI